MYICKVGTENLKKVETAKLYCVSEFNEFKPRLKSPKHRFQLSAGVNLEKFNTNLSVTNHI